MEQSKQMFSSNKKITMKGQKVSQNSGASEQRAGMLQCTSVAVDVVDLVLKKVVNTCAAVNATHQFTGSISSHLLHLHACIQPTHHFLRQLTTWHCSHLLLWLLAAATIDQYLLLAGMPQWHAVVDRQTDIVPLHKHCRTLCEQCQNKTAQNKIDK